MIANTRSDPCPDCGAERVERTDKFLGTFMLLPCGCQEKREAEDQARADRETAEKQTLRRERENREAGLLRGMAGFTLEGWQYRAEVAGAAAEVERYAARLAENVAAGCGLLLTGEPGTGKTHLATALVHRAIGVGIKAQIVNSTELLRSLRPGAPAPEETEEKYRTIALLVIDDLGKEKYSEWVEEVIYHILNFRLNDLRATIITTNFNQAELEKRIGQATVDRILQMCQPVQFKAKSLRKEKARVML